MIVEPIKGTTLPPGPKGRFILDTFARFNRDPLGFLMSCAREYGDIVYLPDLEVSGSKVYMLNHPDFIEEVLVTKSSHFTKNQQLLSKVQSLFGNGVVV